MLEALETASVDGSIWDRVLSVFATKTVLPMRQRSSSDRGLVTLPVTSFVFGSIRSTR